jgi:uncharacterized delta-60 repeat protein
MFATLLVICAACLGASPNAMAQAGHLDPTFGSNGVFSDSFNGGTNQPIAVTLQTDGKIVVAGEINNFGGFIRLNPNGTLDSSFGSGGITTVRFADIDSIAIGVGIQTDGKIVAAGTGLPGGGRLVRLNSNGSVDTSFGSSGFVTLTFTPGLFALLPNGKMLVAGAAAGTPNALMEQFDNNGQPDPTFGTAGQAPLAMRSTSALALQADGKILISSDAPGANPFFPARPSAGSVARYNSNGTLDTTFGSGGQVGVLAAPSALAEQSDGRIVTAGTIATNLSLAGDSAGFGVMRLNSNGSVDKTFATHGATFTGFANFPLTAPFALAIQSNGDIIAAGEAGVSTTQLVESFALARYLSTGQLDSTFGTGGRVTTNFGSNAIAFIGALTLQSDDKIIAVGSNNDANFIVARYLAQ